MFIVGKPYHPPSVTPEHVLSAWVLYERPPRVRNDMYHHIVVVPVLSKYRYPCALRIPRHVTMTAAVLLQNIDSIDKNPTIALAT